MFQVSSAWKAAFPGAHAGVLAMRGVINPSAQAMLKQQKIALEGQLRTRFVDKAAIANHPILQAYNSHYRRFKKTYHVELQLESIIFKGKSIPSTAALIEAMFMAEINNLLLTAGHDLDAVRLPITLDISKGGEQYILLRGQEQVLKAGDMMMSDNEGIISSIIYGPDQRTQIQALTKNVIFTVYAPPGIGEQTVKDHLQELRQNVQLVASEAQVELLRVF